MYVLRIGHKLSDIEVKSIPDTSFATGEYESLRALQEMVGGYIEPCAPVELKHRHIELLANEEGLLTRLPANENLFPYFYVGTLVAVGIGKEDFCSLTRYQIEFLKDWLRGLMKGY